MSEPPLPSARRQLLFLKYGPILITPFFFGFSTHVLAPNLYARFERLAIHSRQLACIQLDCWARN